MQNKKGMLDEIRREAELMETLSHHPNIISFVGAITKTHQNFRSFALIVRTLPVCAYHISFVICVLMYRHNKNNKFEYCERGSLYDVLIKRQEDVSLERLIAMARDAAAGILHLHQYTFSCNLIIPFASYH